MKKSKIKLLDQCDFKQSLPSELKKELKAIFSLYGIYNKSGELKDLLKTELGKELLDDVIHCLKKRGNVV